MIKYAYVNGRILPDTRATISIFDRGFVLGDGLFETLRALDYCPEFLTEHYSRLKKSAQKLKLKVPLSLAEMGSIIYQLCKKSKMRDAGVRITLSRGKYDGGLSISPAIRPTLVIALLEVQSPKSTIYNKGVSVVVSQINKEVASGLDASVKTTNYLANIFAKNEADRKKCYEAILLGKKGEIAELSTSSFFCVQNGVLKTPRLDSGILPGITRNEVLKLAKKLRIPCREANIPLSSVGKMEEAFLTSSIRGIVPIVKIGVIRLGNPKQWAKTQYLMDMYQERCLRSRLKFGAKENAG